MSGNQRCSRSALVHPPHEGIDMSATPKTDGNDYVEAQWRAALVQAERARQDYAQHLRAADREESELGRLWLRLWLAERRRDELFRRLD